MVSYASTSDGFGRKLEEMLDSAEAEFRHAVAYVDAVVIPELRRESAGALRALAIHMEQVAGKLDPSRKRAL